MEVDRCYAIMACAMAGPGTFSAWPFAWPFAVGAEGAVVGSLELMKDWIWGKTSLRTSTTFARSACHQTTL